MDLVHVLQHLEAPFSQDVYQVACGLACRLQSKNPTSTTSSMPPGVLVRLPSECYGQDLL